MWRLSGKTAILSYANNVKSPMNTDTNYQLGTLPFDCQNYYAIITTGRNIFAFISIENNLVSMTPYSDFTSDSWMYFHVPLILKWSLDPNVWPGRCSSGIPIVKYGFSGKGQRRNISIFVVYIHVTLWCSVARNGSEADLIDIIIKGKITIFTLILRTYVLAIKSGGATAPR